MSVLPYEDDSEIILATARAILVSSCHIVDPAGGTAWSAVVCASGMARAAPRIPWNGSMRPAGGGGLNLLANQKAQIAEVQY